MVSTCTKLFELLHVETARQWITVKSQKDFWQLVLQFANKGNKSLPKEHNIREGYTTLQIQIQLYTTPCWIILNFLLKSPFCKSGTQVHTLVLTENNCRWSQVLNSAQGHAQNLVLILTIVRKTLIVLQRLWKFKNKKIYQLQVRVCQRCESEAWIGLAHLMTWDTTKTK